MFLTSTGGTEPRRILAADEIGDAAPLYAAPGVILTLRQGVLMARRFDADSGFAAEEPVPVAEGVGNDSAMFRPAVSVSAAGVLAHRTTGIERRQLDWVDRGGHLLGHVGPSDDNGLAYPTLSPDGQRIAVSRAAMDGNADIWIIDARRGTLTRMTSDPANDLAPLWSPDGKWMVFRTSRAGGFDLYLKLLLGSDDAETPLVADGRTKTALDWTPDSRTLLFGSLNPQSGADLWAVDIAGDRKPYPILRTQFDEMDAHLSPDGRWIAYRSNESGAFRSTSGLHAGRTQPGRTTDLDRRRRAAALEPERPGSVLRGAGRAAHGGAARNLPRQTVNRLRHAGRAVCDAPGERYIHHHRRHRRAGAIRRRARWALPDQHGRPELRAAAHLDRAELGRAAAEAALTPYFADSCPLRLRRTAT